MHGTKAKRSLSFPDDVTHVCSVCLLSRHTVRLLIRMCVMLADTGFAHIYEDPGCASALPICM